jgi:hypothetical protein
MCPVGLHGLWWDAGHESSPNAKVSYDPLKLGRSGWSITPGTAPLVQWNARSDTAQMLLPAVGIDFGDRWEFGLRRDLFPFGEVPAASGITSREWVP